MKISKPHLDFGLYTNRLDEQLAFWQRDVGLPFEEMLPVGGGVRQHRHAMNGSVFKLNHSRDPLPEPSPCGYRRLSIARAGLDAPVHLKDPDGNRVRLVPPGHEGIDGIEIELGVRDPSAFDAFYGEALGLQPIEKHRYRFGDSVLAFAADPAAGRSGSMREPGFRYLTIQVVDVDLEHAGIVARGGEEGYPPRTLGTTARISFVRDPDGNWIEISQRASLTGTLAPGGGEIT
jgi:catechol 2,3-dioxygenase-like lactoylglutathione lyase family enzyme